MIFSKRTRQFVKQLNGAVFLVLLIVADLTAQTVETPEVIAT